MILLKSSWLPQSSVPAALDVWLPDQDSLLLSRCAGSCVVWPWGFLSSSVSQGYPRLWCRAPRGAVIRTVWLPSQLLFLRVLPLKAVANCWVSTSSVTALLRATHGEMISLKLQWHVPAKSHPFLDSYKLHFVRKAICASLVISASRWHFLFDFLLWWLPNP